MTKYVLWFCLLHVLKAVAVEPDRALYRPAHCLNTKNGLPTQETTHIDSLNLPVGFSSQPQLDSTELECIETEEGNEKRQVHMLRMGKRPEELFDDSEESAGSDSKRTVSMLRMGKRDHVDESTYDEPKRTVSMLRMGRAMSTEEDIKRAVNMLRMGKRHSVIKESKRAVNLLRMGRDSTDMEPVSEGEGLKRAVNMLRMGRSDGRLEDLKRTVHMLRMGKRFDTSDAMNGDEDATEQEVYQSAKRPVNMLRMGKRNVGVLRMG